MRVFYFGCITDAGHCLYEAGAGHITQAVRFPGNNPWGVNIDTGLCPGVKDRHGFTDTVRSVQTEGLAEVHHKDGYTALAFWDRTGDSRPGSNSVFLAEGTHDFAKMIEIAKRHFPTVFLRFKFKIVDAINA